jgi:hypothetical protein
MTRRERLMTVSAVLVVAGTGFVASISTVAGAGALGAPFNRTAALSGIRGERLGVG